MAGAPELLRQPEDAFGAHMAIPPLMLENAAPFAPSKLRPVSLKTDSPAILQAVQTEASHSSNKQRSSPRSVRNYSSSQ